MSDGEVTHDINDRDFFSDSNMEAIGEPAAYADWAAGPNEVVTGQLKPRPVGDTSMLVFDENEDYGVTG